MIVNSDLLASLALIALSMIGISLMWFDNPTARKASMFFAFPVILVMAFYILSVPATSVGTPTIMNITSNTIYQNTNSTPLSIYVIAHSTSLKGYLGNTNTTLTKIIDLRGGSITVTGVVYSLTGYNLSAYMQVAPKQYYKFNFTNATFIGEYGDN